MEKNIREYLPFYIGCEVAVLNLDGQIFYDKIESVINDNAGQRFSIYEFGDIEYGKIEEYCQWVKPLLRPLDTMTEEEADAWYRGKLPHPLHAWLNYGPHKKGLYTPAQIKWLLSKFFDIFSLIPEGLALDATKEVNHG